MDWVIAGGVSITAMRKPARSSSASVSLRSRLPVFTKCGSSAVRAFHHCARLPCGSVSISETGPTPARQASTARCPDKVVFPDPPFCDAMTTVYKETPACLPPKFDASVSQVRFGAMNGVAKDLLKYSAYSTDRLLAG